MGKCILEIRFNGTIIKSHTAKTIADAERWASYTQRDLIIDILYNMGTSLRIVDEGKAVMYTLTYTYRFKSLFKKYTKEITQQVYFKLSESPIRIGEDVLGALKSTRYDIGPGDIEMITSFKSEKVYSETLMKNPFRKRR